MNESSLKTVNWGYTTQEQLNTLQAKQHKGAVVKFLFRRPHRKRLSLVAVWKAHSELASVKTDAGYSLFHFVVLGFLNTYYRNFM